LIFGADLGVAGAAWATVVAQTGAAAVFLALILRIHRERLGTAAPIRGFRALGIGRILDAGWPMMVRSAALLVAITATTVAAARIGTVAVAAHQIALQIWLFLSFVLDAYAVAAQAMVGTDMGARDRTSARAVANRLLVLGFATGIGLSILLAITAPLVAGVFSAEPAVEQQLASIYWFVIALQPLTALVYVWDGVAIGASAFRYLAGAMVIACAATLAALVAFGNTLVGVWAAVMILTLVRLTALAWWHHAGTLAVGRVPYPGSRAA
jgi:MATE family multidrug resistance protein